MAGCKSRRGIVGITAYTAHRNLRRRRILRHGTYIVIGVAGYGVGISGATDQSAHSNTGRGLGSRTGVGNGSGIITGGSVGGRV